MGPNSHGGRKAKAIAARDSKTPTRAQFSTWKPPTKGGKESSKQKQDGHSSKSGRVRGGNRVPSSLLSQHVQRTGAYSELPAADRIMIPENIIRTLMKVFGHEYESEQGQGQGQGQSGTKGISVGAGNSRSNMKVQTQEPPLALPLPLPLPPPSDLSSAIATVVNGNSCSSSGINNISVDNSSVHTDCGTSNCTTAKVRTVSPAPRYDWSRLPASMCVLAERFLQLGFTETELWSAMHSLSVGASGASSAASGASSGVNKPSPTGSARDIISTDELFLYLIMKAAGHPLPTLNKTNSGSSKGDKKKGVLSSGLPQPALLSAEDVLLNEDLMGEVEVLGSIYSSGEAGGGGDNGSGNGTGNGSVNTTPLVLFGTPMPVVPGGAGSKSHSNRGGVMVSVGGIPCLRTDITFSVSVTDVSSSTSSILPLRLLLTLFIYHADVYPIGKASLGVSEGSRIYGWVQQQQQQQQCGPSLSSASLRALSLAAMETVQRQHNESEAPVAFDFIQWVAGEAPDYLQKDAASGGAAANGYCFLGSEIAVDTSAGAGNADNAGNCGGCSNNSSSKITSSCKTSTTTNASKAAREDGSVSQNGQKRQQNIKRTPAPAVHPALDVHPDPDAPIEPPALVAPLTRHMESLEYRTAYSRALSNGLTGPSARRAARDEMEFVLPASALKELVLEVKYAVAMQERGYCIKDIGTREIIEGGKLLGEKMPSQIQGQGLNKAQCKELYLSAKDQLFHKGEWYARDVKSMQSKLVLTAMMIHAERVEKREQKRREKSSSSNSNSTRNSNNSSSNAGSTSSCDMDPTVALAAVDVAGMSITGQGQGQDQDQDQDQGRQQQQQSVSSEPLAAARRGHDPEQPVNQEEEDEEDEEDEPLPEEIEAQRRRDESRRQKQQLDSEMLLKSLEEKRQNPKYREQLARRQNLPAFKMREQVLQAIQEHSVVVVSGDTGCGKTTQIPQLVLDDCIDRGKGGECNIIVTQPRRISAVSVAEHISRERAETLGQSTGYHIRLEAKKSQATRLLLMTTGVLLRRLQTSSDLDDVSHIFVDEVHERDIDTDFLLIVLKQLLRRKPELKVILMSATLNANMFLDYFAKNITGGSCGIISIPGRAFPVTTYYLEDALEHTAHEVRAGGDYAYKAPRGESGGGGGGGNKGAYRGSGGASKTPKVKSPEQLRRVMLDNIQALQKSRKLTPRTVQSLQTVEESILNLELIQDLVMHIMATTATGTINVNDHGVSGSQSQPNDNSCTCSGSKQTKDEEQKQQAAAILIFVPGLSDIRAVCDCLEEREELREHARILPLHSSLSSQEQGLVFQLPPPGKRKIIVSTNIAETSVTIEDVVYVIDTCRVKENCFDDDAQMNVLQEQWHSQANARQRRGRAGRVRAGICYHLCCSFTLSNLAPYTEPEMRRMSLEELILQVLALNLGDPYEFLGSALSPPETVAVTNAVLYLESLNAVIMLPSPLKSGGGDPLQIGNSSASTGAAGTSAKKERRVSCQITPLGFHLAALPISPKIGKLVLFGVLLRCIDPVLTIASILSAKSPFVSPFSERDAADIAKMSFMGGHSDLVTALNAYESWRGIVDKGRGDGTGGNSSSSIRKEEDQFCRSKFLSQTALRLVEQMRGQFLQLIKGIGFMPNSCNARNIRTCDENSNGSSMAMIKCAICAGLSPNILMIPVGGGGGPGKPGQTPSATASFGAQILSKMLGEVPLQQRRKDVSLVVHPSSVMSGVKQLDSKFLVFLESIKTSRMYARDVTTVLPLTLALFSGRLKCNETAGYVMVDEWIKLACAPKVVRCLLLMTDAIDDAFKAKVIDPTAQSSEVWKQVLKVIEMVS